MEDWTFGLDFFRCRLHDGEQGTDGPVGYLLFDEGGVRTLAQWIGALDMRLRLGHLCVVRAFKAVSFFFELDGPLTLEGRRYRCCGSILSRSPDSRALVQNLGASYPYAQFSNSEVSLGFLSLNDICNLCGRFRKAVTFYIRHPSDRVTFS